MGLAGCAQHCLELRKRLGSSVCWIARRKLDREAGTVRMWSLASAVINVGCSGLSRYLFCACEGVCVCSSGAAGICEGEGMCSVMHIHDKGLAVE